jgi:hypothetical protein
MMGCLCDSSVATRHSALVLQLQICFAGRKLNIRPPQRRGVLYGCAEIAPKNTSMAHILGVVSGSLRPEIPTRSYSTMGFREASSFEPAATTVAYSANKLVCGKAAQSLQDNWGNLRSSSANSSGAIRELPELCNRYGIKPVGDIFGDFTPTLVQ